MKCNSLQKMQINLLLKIILWEKHDISHFKKSNKKVVISIVALVYLKKELLRRVKLSQGRHDPRHNDIQHNNK